MDYVATLIACALVGLLLWAAPRVLTHDLLPALAERTLRHSPAALPAPSGSRRAAPAKPATLLLGDAAATTTTPGWFGHYRLEAVIGRGAMGEVWRAFDQSRSRHVALKLLPTHPPAGTHAEDSAAAGARMQHEARLAGALCSAHVIPVHDFGHINGAAYLDMRLVDGGDLAALLAHHPHGLHPRRGAAIVTQIADALDAAHRAGLVHGDVKPANVLLDSTTTGEFCYLADFGIATTTDPTDRPRTSVRGTAGYIAPELFTGAAPAPAADIYALGVLLHELLTGHPPTQTTDQTAVPAVRPTPISPAVDRVLRAALAAAPAERHPSAGALAAAAARAVEADSATTAPPTWREAPTRLQTLGRDAAPRRRHAPDSFDGVFIPAPATPSPEAPAIPAARRGPRLPAAA